MKVLIYSNEHGAWWRPNYCGYTTRQEKAGVFDYEEAHKRYPIIGFNRQDEDYFIRLDGRDNTQETKLTPLETFELLCRSYVDDMNTLRHKDIEKDYLYNEKYGATITDIKTGRSGKTADIETALKEYELIKQTKIIAANKKISKGDLENLKNQRMFIANLDQCEIKPLFDEETQKKLKALEIIKEKRVNIGDFVRCKNIEDYNEYCCYNEKEELTQEEFDLLKKVLS